MALLAAGSPLVAGSSQEKDMLQAPPKTARARVLRAFYIGGKATSVGAVVELPRVFALEMAAAKKVELLPEPKAEDMKPAEDKKTKGP